MIPIARNKSLGALLALVVAASSAMPAAARGLGLRVHDAIGEPGGRIAIVLRTYASRPIGQGQLCLRVSEGPLLSLTDVLVFASAVDTQSQATPALGSVPQFVMLEFSSPSASINDADGPLAVLFLSLNSDVAVGQRFALSIDPMETFLFDAQGQPIPIDPRPGRLSIRAPGAPVAVAAHAESTVPGGIARLSFETYEPILLASGRVAFRYEPAIATGPPTVTIDPRHGHATLTADTSIPGLVVVDFQSDDGSLNGVPGSLIDVSLPTSSGVAPGSSFPVSLDPTLTFLNDAAGQPLPLLLGGDVLEFSSGTPGEASGLMVRRAPGGLLQLAWNADCGAGSAYAVYRGDLSLGYNSLGPEPGMCEVEGSTVTFPEGTGSAEFFLVVPHEADVEGSFGAASSGVPRPRPSATCYTESAVHACAP